MNIHIKWILRAISLVILVVPICSGLLIYGGNLSALVMPEKTDFLKDTPQVEWIGYQASTHKLEFKFSNPWKMAIMFNSMSADVYCKDHNVLIGAINLPNPVTVQPKFSQKISLVITFSSTAQSHFINYHFGAGASAELRNMEFTVQGVKLTSNQPMDIGTIIYP